MIANERRPQAAAKQHSSPQAAAATHQPRNIFNCSDLQRIRRLERYVLEYVLVFHLPSQNAPLGPVVVANLLGVRGKHMFLHNAAAQGFNHSRWELNSTGDCRSNS